MSTPILKFLDRPIAFHRCLAQITGSTDAALMLSQALYWQGRTKDPDGWWWKTMDEWEEETSLGRRPQEKARSILRSLEILEEAKRGLPSKLYFRVNLERLEEHLDALSEAAQGCPKAPNKDVQNGQTRMSRNANQGCPETPTKDVQNGQTSMSKTDIHSLYRDYYRDYYHYREASRGRGAEQRRTW